MSLKLETNRLVLKDFRYEDLLDLLPVFTHPDFEFFGVEKSQKGCADYIARKIRNNSLQTPDGAFRLGYNLTIRFKNSSEIIGFIGAGCAPPFPDYLHGYYEFGFFTAPDYRGQKVIKEAGKELQDYLKSIVITKFGATVHPNNHPSIAILNYLGLVFIRDLIADEVKTRNNEPRQLFLTPKK